MDAQFYEGRGNDVSMTLTNNGVVVLPAAITKIEFKYSGGSINSDDNPSLFEFEASSIKLKFGGLDSGTYKMALIVYSVDYPEGVVWDNEICINVDEV